MKLYNFGENATELISFFCERILRSTGQDTRNYKLTDYIKFYEFRKIVLSKAIKMATELIDEVKSHEGELFANDDELIAREILRAYKESNGRNRR